MSNKIKYKAFGQTREIVPEIYLNGKRIESEDWEVDFWVERPEEWYSLSSSQLKNKKVLIVTRENWLSSKIVTDEELPILKPEEYKGTPQQKSTIEYGRYLVVRKDGKKHLETFNGTGWAYNNNSIIAFYRPKID